MMAVEGFKPFRRENKENKENTHDAETARLAKTQTKRGKHRRRTRLRIDIGTYVLTKGIFQTQRAISSQCVAICDDSESVTWCFSSPMELHISKCVLVLIQTYVSILVVQKQTDLFHSLSVDPLFPRHV